MEKNISSKVEKVFEEDRVSVSDIDLSRLTVGYEDKLDITIFRKRLEKWLAKRDGEELDSDRVSDKIIQTALESVDISAPDWTFVAARELLNSMYRDARRNRGYKGKSYGSFYQLINKLSKRKKGTKYPVYDKSILESYTKEEIVQLGKIIDPEKDKLFSYMGLFLLKDRYIATFEKDKVYELPQERFLIIAMSILKNEPKEHRLNYIKEAYWALSNLYMTVATPTLSNAGKHEGQLSSCFIDVMEDSVDGIYSTNYDTARVSKNGGGQGVYMGKVRPLSSDIRGQAGVSSGVTPWIKLLNQTAVSVDQLGQRKGAVAVYLDVFHKDIMRFLDLKTNNGDERGKAHDVFTGVCLPDIFMEKVDAREEWYTFDARLTELILGFRLEDSFDEKKGEGTFRTNYNKAVEAAKNGTLPEIAFTKFEAINIMKSILKSQLETGVPYMFYRDEVNRANANSHQGMIYASNLCTEIFQNNSPTLITKEYYTEEGTIITERQSGDFVVCNLSSINLARAVMDDVLERLIKIQVRLLDNVIDVNNLPVPQASITNGRYRSIGLGTFGWAHLLALKSIYWESEEAISYADELYEKIAYLTIKESANLAKEKGAYKYFEGSDWHTGAYFDKRGYVSDKWIELKEDIKINGIRNGYLMAVAPNSSTAKIANSTDGIDPLYGTEHIEEKKNFKFKVTAPDLDHKTYEYYKKNRYNLDQLYSIKQNSARQRHIDQGVSFNIYVYSNIKAAELLKLHMETWKHGIKTSYYIKSSTYSDANACDACQ